jgi:orotidine-5'-phosphate decarboxylase
VVDLKTGQARPQFEIFADRALQWQADGAIVGATFTDIISRVYTILGSEVPIFSPGIGVQGGSLRDAMNAGAKYVIVGRSIYESEDPARSAEELRAGVTTSG